MVVDVCPLPGAGRNRPLPLLLPPTMFRLRIISSVENLQKLFLWWGLPHTSFLCLLMLFFGLNILPQTWQTNTWPLCCQIWFWLSVGKDLIALSQTLKGWTLSLTFALFPHTDHIQKQHELSHKRALYTSGSRCQKMSTPLYVQN